MIQYVARIGLNYVDIAEILITHAGEEIADSCGVNVYGKHRLVRKLAGEGCHLFTGPESDIDDDGHIRGEKRIRIAQLVKGKPPGRLMGKCERLPSGDPPASSLCGWRVGQKRVHVARLRGWQMLGRGASAVLVWESGSLRNVRRRSMGRHGGVTVEQIVASPRYVTKISELAEETGRPRPEVDAEGRADLVELVATIERRPTRVWDSFGQWLSRSYTIDASTEELPKLRALSRNHSLVFLPNHRSYLDPLVLRRVLGEGGLPSNFILGGINLAMWPATLVAKRSGLIFIRRSTRDDPIYPAMMRLYLGMLLQQHANLEWYFEGGRTRTGKLRPPRMGVLRYLMDAYAENRSEPGDNGSDVYIVPVSIVYDQQHEVGAISSEDSGGAKTPESLRWLVSFARAQSLRRGQVHVRFGEPLRLGEIVDDARERAGSLSPQTVVPRVAFEIAHRINDATPITPSALVSFALLDNEGRALTHSELLSVLEPLLAYIRTRNLPLTSDIDLARPEGVEKALSSLRREGVVESFSGGLETVYAIARDRNHEAAFYRNTVAHWFVYRAIAENALLGAAGSECDDVVDTTWQCALALRDLLKYEFFFPRKRDFAEKIRDEIDIAQPGWAGQNPSVADVITDLDNTALYLSHRVIGPFLEAYAVVAERLAETSPYLLVDNDALVNECLGIARQEWLQLRLHSPESISRDLMQGALKLADNRGLLEVGGEDMIRRRQEFAAELRHAVDRVAIVRQAAMARLSDDDAGVSDMMNRR